MRSDRERLLDILEAIDEIDRYAVRGRSAFDADELIRSWMLQRVQVIGEAAAVVSPELKAAHPDVSWQRSADMRNVIVHAYHRVDPDVVWTVVERDLPILREQIAAILADMGDADG